jgi:hypothetical protein
MYFLNRISYIVYSMKEQRKIIVIIGTFILFLSVYIINHSLQEKKTSVI